MKYPTIISTNDQPHLTTEGNVMHYGFIDDGAVATIMALDWAIRHQGENESVYSGRELRNFVLEQL